MFNSLKYAKKLEEAGVSREQAEVHILILTEIMETNLATKQDIRDLDKRHLDLIFARFERRLSIKISIIAFIAIVVSVSLSMLFL